MSVSLYYTARRTAPLSGPESAAVARVVAARQASFPYEDEESLYVYDPRRAEPGTVLDGSTKMPFDPGRLLPVIAHVLDSVTELRRTLPDAEWHVHMDDLDIEWDGAKGYELPGMRDPDLAAAFAEADREGVEDASDGRATLGP
ncbi:hypothetical protein K388_00692 [Streptomyces sp. KhCrAH-43]|uniref:hypothetical protein n=1 Tax=unclassified Streptomyces TaxID=2593676 RepID=UPI00036B5F1C|nr:MULTISPECIES: hypothetical protein [unclassified Streptomyces]MYS38267.1 hypothetical protein [Streptomyces sp. SID4920]MYX66458.1 hypothetical protein [Streptomyces sp. SID8373]RAJ67949.1 hypothetical protein K388_00692 [Streptomyces sp. KhCrAH-43]